MIDTPLKALVLALVLATLVFSTRTFADSVTLESWVNPFDVKSPRRSTDYQWDSKSSKQHRICAFIPNSETSYWFAVNYGLVKKARELGVSLKVFHTSSTHSTQGQNVDDKMVQKCLDHKPNGLIIDDTFGPALSQTLSQFPKNLNVIAVGKNLLQSEVDASSSASFNEIGQQLAKYMNQTQGSAQIQQTVMFPGDRNMQFVGAFVDGFIPNLNSNKFHLRDTIYTQNNYLDIKSALTRYLNSNLDTSIIIGSAKVAQAAVEVLNEMSLTGDIEIVSYELSAQIFRDIKRGHISAAVANPPVTQGFLAIDMAVKLAEKRLNQSHVSPRSTLIDADNLAQFDISRVFAPYGYRETLEVN